MIFFLKKKSTQVWQKFYENPWYIYLPPCMGFCEIIYIGGTLKNCVQLLLSTAACVWAFHLICLPEWRIWANEMGRQHDHVAMETWSFRWIFFFLSVCCFGNFRICSFAAFQKFLWARELRAVEKIFWSGWQVILEWWHNHR